MSAAPGVNCSCSNISVMQLFHELKQQFPTVPDDVVNKCIVEHCHDRPKCRQQLKEAAAAAVPKTMPYPPALAKSSLPANQKRTEGDGSCAAELQKMTTNSSHNLLESNQGSHSKPVADQQFEHLTISSNKPPISPSVTKRFTRPPTKSYEARISKVPNNELKEPLTVNSDVKCNNNIQSGTGAVRKSPVRPSTLNLQNRFGSCDNNINQTSCDNNQVAKSSVNLSVNVNCSVDINTKQAASGSGQKQRRHSAVLEVTPEPVWITHHQSPTTNSPRSFTSVNLTLRTPTSDPQPTIDICSTPSSCPSLTYTTTSFDRRQGLESRLQITVGPTSGEVTAVRRRPLSGFLEGGARREVEGGFVTRTESMPELERVDARVDATNRDVLLSRQIERKEQLRSELEAGRERLSGIKKEIQALRLQKIPESRNRLKKEIRHLQAQCESLTQEVDQQTESRLPLGETNEAFYQHRNFKSLTGSQSYAPTIAPDLEDEPRWQCHICTFRNHPLMNHCEQCDMPRMLLGKIAATNNPIEENNAIDGVVVNTQHGTNNNNTPLALGMNFFSRSRRKYSYQIFTRKYNTGYTFMGSLTKINI